MTASKEKLLIPSESGNVTVDGVKYTQVGPPTPSGSSSCPRWSSPEYPPPPPPLATGTLPSILRLSSYKLSIPTDSAEYPTLTFTIGEGCTVKLGTKALTADENGNYTVKLTASEQKINVTLNGLTQPYVLLRLQAVWQTVPTSC